MSRESVVKKSLFRKKVEGSYCEVTSTSELIDCVRCREVKRAAAVAIHTFQKQLLLDCYKISNCTHYTDFQFLLIMLENYILFPDFAINNGQVSF